jgi:hypothetical protein
MVEASFPGLLSELVLGWPGLFCCEKSWIILNRRVVSFFVCNALDTFGFSGCIYRFSEIFLVQGRSSRWFSWTHNWLGSRCRHHLFLLLVA